MKNIVKGIGVCLTILLISTGCSSKSSSTDDTESSVPQVTPDEISAKNNVVTINIIDASSGKAADSATVQFEGTALDIEDDPMPATMKTDDTGLVTFYSKVGEHVKVLVSKAGYISTGIELNIADGINRRTVNLVKFDPDNPPSGLLMKADSVDMTNGVVEDDKNITLEDNATLSLPAGTKLMTASGKEAVGVVKIQTTYYSAEKTEYFPGGLSVRLAEPVQTPDGSTEDVDFISAGFTSIEMVDSEGSTITDFVDGALKITMTIPDSTINPQTGTDVAEGDVIPIWSYDVTKGIWSYSDKDGTVVLQNGKLVVEYEAEHLSYWNLDWHYSPVCQPGTIDIGDLSNPTDIITSLEVYTTGFSRTVYDYQGEGKYELNNIPSTLPLTFTLKYDGEERDKLTNVILDNSNCSITMNVDVATIVPKEPVSVKVVEQCSNGLHKQAVPYVSVYMQSGIAWNYAGLTATDGSAEIMLAPGNPDGSNIRAYAYGRGYTSDYASVSIPAGNTESHELVFIFGSEYDDYCTPTGATGGS